MKKIIVACAGGVATSTLICDKVENLIRERKLDAEVYQCRISEIKANLDKACVILCSARLEEHYSVPVLQALPFITGVGLPEMSEKLIQIVKG